MESRQQAEHAAAAWIARRDAGPWTEEDSAAFDAWLAQSAGHRAAYFRFNAAWQETGRLRALISAPAAAAWKPHRRFFTRRTFQFAAAATLLLAVGSAAFLLRDAFGHRSRYSTVVGGLAAVPLADGSKVTLNTDSELRIVLTATERRIDLDRGEAFFEVARDPSRPFVVIAADKRIVAIGTAFSVRHEGQNVRVAVAEGEVRLEAPGKTPPVSLPAGSVVRTRREDILVQTRPLPEIEQTLSWRSGLLTFRDTPLADAVAELNRYNARRIVIADPSIAAIGIGGIFRSTNLDPFVNLLEQGFPIRATPDGDRIVLTAK